MRFFESLDRIVQAEPWLDRDKAMIDMLKSIGIEKGKSFNPDAATQEIAGRSPLTKAHALARPEIRDFLLALLRGHATGRCRRCPSCIEAAADRSSQSRTPIRSTRAASPTTCAFFSAKHLGEGQFYLMTIHDKNGDAARRRRAATA